MSGPIIITIYGTPQPAGSKRGFYRGGKVIVTDDNAKSRPWKNLVTDACRQVYDGPLLEGALTVTMVFFMVRPKGHYGSGKNSAKLKPSAPAWPTSKPDVLKLARGTEDALTGVLWKDDAQTAMLRLQKQYAEDGRPRCVVTVAQMGE